MARTWAKIFLILTAGVVGLILLVAVLINTSFGHRTVAALVEPLSGGRVSVEGLSGRIPYSLRAQRVELRDDNGPWLIIEDVIVDWSPFALLWNRADVSRFEARHMQVLRLPSEDDDQSAANFAVDVRDLRIGLLETTAEISKTPASVEMRGAVRYESLESWSADLVANRLDAPGLYSARASLEDGLLTGTAAIEEPAAGLAAGLLGLNDVGAIEIQVMGSGPREANAIELTFAAGPLRASGRGLIDLIARTAQLDFSAQAPEMALRPDLAWQSLSADGQLRGSFDAPDVNATLDVRDLRAQDVNVERVTANLTGRTGNVDFTASLAGLRLPGSEPDMFARDPISARGTIELQTPARQFTVSLSHPLLTVEAQGTAGDTKRTEANISVPRLAPFAERGGIDLDGRAAFTAIVAQIGDDFRIDAEGTISAAPGEEPLSRLIGPNARVRLGATTANGSDIAISDARIEGAAANAQLRTCERERHRLGLDTRHR
jgi:translocation and assembly module TamB